MADWIPKQEGKLLMLQGRWAETLSDPVKQEAFGWVAADCAAVTDKIAAFAAAKGVYNDVDSRENRIAKDAAKTESVAVMRDFANGSVRFNRRMSAGEKEFLGIRPRAVSPGRRPRPVSQPDADVRNTRNHFEHELRALNAEGNATKPDDADGVVFAWQVGGERPASGADLPRSRAIRRASTVVCHSEADKGKTVWYAVCYQNSRGDRGPWSPVVEAVIA
ncbi:MAG: hypothetical protein MdMp014T_1994 [Treponematales bacterium]